MLNTTCYRSARGQSGVGLVELMIAMTLGLFLLGGLSYFLLGTKQTGRTADDLSRMQENGRYALDSMAASIRQAGYKDDPDQAFTAIYGVPALVTTQGAGGAPDTITVRHAPQDGTETDCSGVTPASGEPITEVYTVTNGNLTCNGMIVSPQIADMQLQLVQGSATGAAQAYAEPGAVDDNNVVAVQVSLLAVSPRSGVSSGSQAVTFHGTTTTFSDGRLRQVYSATTALRNRVQNEPHPVPAT